MRPRTQTSRTTRLGAPGCSLWGENKLSVLKKTKKQKNPKEFLCIRCMFVVLTGTVKLMALGGTNIPAPNAVRCLVLQTALLAFVSARGTMPSVLHCFSLSLKYWHREAKTPTSKRTPAGLERGPHAVLTLIKYSSVVSYDLGVTGQKKKGRFESKS